MSQNPIKVIHKKKGMDALMKKLESIQDYQSTAGIQKNEGRRLVKYDTWKKSGFYNRATIARALETDYDGPNFHRPARYFIKLQNVPEVWNDIKEYLRSEFTSFLQFKGRGRREGTYVLKRIADFAVKKQKYQILDGRTAPNSDSVAKEKGFNHPLFFMGEMEESIKSKVIDNRTGKKIRFSKKWEATEKSIMDLGR